VEDEIWRGASLLANERPSLTRHYALDHLGSPRALTGSAGTFLGTQDFQPYGAGGTTDGGALQFTEKTHPQRNWDHWCDLVSRIES
jgi:hypothetical protein